MHEDFPEPPAIDKALLDWLEKILPERSPNPLDSDREIWMKAGERRLINMLRMQWGDQQNNILEI